MRKWINALLPDGCWRAPKRISKLDQCAFTGWLLESAKALFENNQCAFTRWLLESVKAHFETGSMRFYPMAAGERQSAFRNWTNAILPDGCWRAPKRISKLDQCAFTRWLLESAKAHFETESMQFWGAY
jgi:hypothetical protein